MKCTTIGNAIKPFREFNNLTSQVKLFVVGILGFSDLHGGDVFTVNAYPSITGNLK
jgi:hypothetical protein